MRIARILLGLAVVLPVAVAADEKPPTGQGELKRLTGTWVMFDMELNGSGDGRAEAKRIVFDGNKYTFYHEKNKSPEATFTLNPGADPRTIDVKQGGKTMLGIYRFKEGRLEICLAQDRKPRPTAFATEGEPGAGSILYVLKPKTPPAKLDPAEAVYQDEMKKLAGKWVAAERELAGRAEKDPKDHGLLVEDGRLTMLFKGNKRDNMKAIRVNPKADPPEIDFRTSNGKVWLAIYKMSDEKLEICLPSINTGKRPTAFTTKAEPGAGVSYTVYQKEKKKE